MGETTQQQQQQSVKHPLQVPQTQIVSELLRNGRPLPGSNAGASWGKRGNPLGGTARSTWPLGGTARSTWPLTGSPV